MFGNIFSAECFKTFTGVNQKMPAHFISEQVVALTGITPRQLQWWDERGIVVPAREGRNRLYSMDDLAEIAVVCELRRKGFSLQRVRKIMRYLQRELGKRLAETVTAGSDYHLLTDGTRIYLENSDREVIDILKNSKQPMLAVCLSDTIREIHAEIKTQAGPAKSARVRAEKRKNASARPFLMAQAKRRAMS
jgi:DNA-binding transcriptional MerR regulator